MLGKMEERLAALLQFSTAWLIDGAKLSVMSTGCTCPLGEINASDHRGVLMVNNREQALLLAQRAVICSGCVNYQALFQEIPSEDVFQPKVIPVGDDFLPCLVKNGTWYVILVEQSTNLVQFGFGLSFRDTPRERYDDFTQARAAMTQEVTCWPK